MSSAESFTQHAVRLGLKFSSPAVSTRVLDISTEPVATPTFTIPILCAVTLVIKCLTVSVTLATNDAITTSETCKIKKHRSTSF